MDNTKQNAIDTINELLGIGKSTDIGKKLIDKFGSISLLSQNLDAAGLTERQAQVLRAAFKINFIREDDISFNSPADAYAYVKDLQTEPKEVLVALILDRRNHVIARETVYRGSVNSSQVRVAECFRKAIILNASAIILAHNHPSGDPTPSPDDVAVTRAIVSAGKILDIDLLDHIVVGAGKYVSLKERGLGFRS